MGGLFRNMQYPVQFWQKNIDMDENIIRCCWETKKEVREEAEKRDGVKRPAVPEVKRSLSCPIDA